MSLDLIAYLMPKARVKYQKLQCASRAFYLPASFCFSGVLMLTDTTITTTNIVDFFQ